MQTMLTFWGAKATTYCDGISRRGFLKAGALGCAGLTLADIRRLRAQATSAAQPPARKKAVIMVCLPGGPSHMDSYDLKPDAPAEYRGEFQSMPTNVPGIRICELLPLQAKIAE